MSYDVFLSAFRDGQPADGNRERVREVLGASIQPVADRAGSYMIHLSDGTEANLVANGLAGEGSFSSCAFRCRGPSPALAELIFRVAEAGNFVVVAPGEGSLILTASEQRDHVPLEMADGDPNSLPMVSSESELEVILRGGQTVEEAPGEAPASAAAKPAKSARKKAAAKKAPAKKPKRAAKAAVMKRAKPPKKGAKKAKAPAGKRRPAKKKVAAKARAKKKTARRK